jgi:hypothetical protein
MSRVGQNRHVRSKLETFFHVADMLPTFPAKLESCCLGTATIIFQQFKQIMLTGFYFVWTVSGALIAADD